MAKLYIICGHGDGDPGACANGYKEAERVRALGKKIKELGGSNVVLMDTSKNWYEDGGISTYKFPTDAIVCELHLDSASASAKGGHVIIKDGLGADKYDKNIAKFINEMFPGRSVVISERGDLANPNRAAARGINYRLVECCFISNADDIKKFNSNLDKIAKGFIEAVGLKVVKTTKTTSTTKKTTSTSTKTTSSSSNTKSSSLVTVKISDLNIRSGPGTNYKATGKFTGKGTFTITEVRQGKGSKAGWGKLKSGAGWISLDYCTVKK